MIFDKVAINKEIFKAKEQLIESIKENGLAETDDFDAREDLQKIHVDAALDALENPHTRYQGLRKILWQFISDTAYEKASEDLLDEIENETNAIRDDRK